MRSSVFKMVWFPFPGLSQAIDPTHLSAFADEGSALFVLRKEVSPGEPYPHVSFSSGNRKLRVSVGDSAKLWTLNSPSWLVNGLWGRHFNWLSLRFLSWKMVLLVTIVCHYLFIVWLLCFEQVSPNGNNVDFIQQHVHRAGDDDVRWMGDKYTKEW